ncbi:prephenate dehydratase domain-containing protein [Granulicella mallensis]|uniref:Prephenate dehydratase n=1 Tax=Granulicella mallensis TaxID=940614 RepID=A0A7W7ZSZ3_9BACT|nr:prephenate dehydratase domain-containing protein [Granulicella mallensis]MBB5065233.1 prephenate dehydratase [Granulicella mallensis]
MPLISKTSRPQTPSIQRIAIQGECGSNSHMAALAMLGAVEVVPCSVSAEVIQAVLLKEVDGAVLPIENSLHGSVAEHYDLLLEYPVRIDRESLLRIRHNLIVAPGVRMAGIHSVLSHPVALSQCRHYLATLDRVHALPFYDTAGSVKHIMEKGLRDTAGVAPELAAKEYGAEILVAGIEDHTENYTRFHLLQRADAPRPGGLKQADKLSVAFALQHRPGTLVAALQRLAEAGVDLTKIESRPVPGKPWEYVFYVDFRFTDAANADAALLALKRDCSMVKELGRYSAA